MKAVLISIQPKWCELIASGNKTIEVRKTKPKIQTPFKCYIYCTHNNRKYALHTYINSGYGRKNFGVIGNWRSGKYVVDVSSHLPAYRYNAYLAEGKVIGEFVCDKIDNHCLSDLIVKEDAEHTLSGTCLTKKEVLNYLGYQKGTSIYACKNYDFYGWHISNLVIYDEPKELSEFYRYCGDNPNCEGCEAHYYSNTESGKEDYCCSDIYGCKPLTRPPQSWCYVEERREQ